ncbi:hypothetical protein ACFLQ8_02740 [Candidatus Auribacterota bacterium]
MNDRKTKMIITAGAIIVGCMVVVLWLLLPLKFSPRNQAPVTSKELFLIKVESEMDNMRILLALKTNLGFTEAQDPAERIRDLCFNMDKKGWKKWGAIVDDMHSWYIRLAVDGTASLSEVLDELYSKYPFLRLEGVEGQGNIGDMIVRTPAGGTRWNTSSIEWKDIPGLMITLKFSEGNVFVVFEGDMVIVSAAVGSRSGYVRLLVDGEERDAGEVRAVATPGGISETRCIMLTWKGELTEGVHTIRVQAKVSDQDTSLRSVDSGDIPKLALIQ